MSDIVISRAGANAICELLALKKPNLLIPLSANASRGDQILNARSFERQGYSKVLEEESVNAQTLQSAIREVYENRQTYINAMKKSSHTDSIGPHPFPDPGMRTQIVTTEIPFLWLCQQSAGKAIFSSGSFSPADFLW